MDTWNDIQGALSELDQQIADSVTPHKAEDAGLDPRCGMIYLGEDFLATRNRRSLDYYGGFEYVDSEYIQQVGGWTLYSVDDSCVLRAMTTLEHNHD